MILKNGEEYEVQDVDVLQWQKTYKEIDVHLELDKMESWLNANEQKRKTRKGIKRFINSWLNRANEKGGSPIEVTRNKTSTRNTSIDADLYDISWLPKDEQEDMKPYLKSMADILLTDRSTQADGTGMES